jgi:lipoprotein-anchoring transpeptidase ErfK/SrfK
MQLRSARLQTSHRLETTDRERATARRGTSPMNGAMPGLTRRAAILVSGGSALGAAMSLAGCATRSTVDPAFLRQSVAYETKEAAGTIVVDPANHFLYHVQKGGQAIRYGAGVGGEGFGWSGVAIVHDKREWPDWYPTKEILQRKPEIRSALVDLHGGLGMPGGPENPLGARALYLWQGSKDTLYRIHGTNEPWTIGQSVSAGCIRMINNDIVDLYEGTPVRTKVVVLPSGVG